MAIPARVPQSACASTARRCRAGGLALLIGAIAALVFFWLAGQRQDRLLGPYSLAAVGGELLIGENGRVIRADALGRVLGEEATAELGIDAPVAVLVPVDDSRYLIGSASGRRLVEMQLQGGYTGRWIDLQWPEDLANAAGQGAHFAASPPDAAGHFDIAAAAGDSVLLFDDRGQLKARTAAGLYRSTRGLVHAGDGWWTTDTRRFKLRRLDPLTLRETAVIDLEEGHTDIFLGLAIASFGNPLPAVPGMKPLLTLTRLDRTLRRGRVVDVFPDAREAEFRSEAPIAPRGVAWLGGRLVVLDGESQQLLTFGAARQALAAFGDAALASRLAATRAEREQAGRQRQISLALAALLLVAGLALLGWPTLRTLRWPLPNPPEDRLALPPASHFLRLWLAVFWPLPVLAAGLSLFALRLPPIVGLIVAVLIIVGLVAWLLWLPRRVADPRFECVLNHRALNWLERSPLWPAIRRRDERALEILAVRQGWRRGIVLLTTQRLLFWEGGIERASLLGEWSRQGPLAARFEAAGHRPWEGDGRLVVEHDGIAEGWHFASPLTADRLRVRLAEAGELPVRVAIRPVPPRQTPPETMGEMEASGASGALGGLASLSIDGLVPLDDDGQLVREEAPIAPNVQAEAKPAVWHALATCSAIAPGWGQWRQGRPGAAVALAAAAGGHVAFAVLPLLGSALAGGNGVPGLAIVWAISGWILLAASSALEIWRHALRATP